MAMIEPTVNTLGDAALVDAILDDSLTELQDDLITNLPAYGWRDAAALKKVVFGSVTKMANHVFASDTGLKIADFHKITSIGDNAFAWCSNFDTLILRGSTLCTLGGSSVFRDTPIASGTGYIYVPAVLVDSYKTASRWSTYAAQIRAIEDYPEVCDPYSWEAVAKAIEAGTYKDVYKIGDCVPVDLGSEGVINMQIAAFDADTLADGTGTAAISWVAKELLATNQRMNPARAGSSGAYTEGTGSIGGWEKCEMRTYLNNTIKPLIPAAVAGMIKSVTKTQTAFDAAGTSFTQTTTDEVWIPGRDEVEVVSGKTTLYSALFQNNASRKKYKVNGVNVVQWSLRSVGSSSTSGFYSVATTGVTSTSQSASSALGVCLGFCTGKTPA